MNYYIKKKCYEKEREIEKRNRIKWEYKFN